MLGLAVAAGSVAAEPIENGEDLANFDGETWDFERFPDGAQFGKNISAQQVTMKGWPDMVTFADSQIVEANANLASASGGAALRSATVLDGTLENRQTFSFSSGKIAVGFYFVDEEATSVTIEARGQAAQLLDSVTLPASPDTRYAGFTRDQADIYGLTILAAHGGEFPNTPVYIDDFFFAAE
jgi:hypothetical protein